MTSVGSTFDTTGLDKTTPLQRKLSYIELTMQDSGTLVDKEEKRELRQKLGYCLECEGLPVKLYMRKQSVLNPFRMKREPLSVTGECADGVCFACYPQRDPSLSPEWRRHRFAIKSPSFRR
mmetsp:Transcript_19008/g.47069  ORF Transcript_19008/g.47069 Transcript_19008/m.47069 type:complete len:121 (-) Transcript_19008:78-440(-)